MRTKRWILLTLSFSIGLIMTFILINGAGAGRLPSESMTTEITEAIPITILHTNDFHGHLEPDSNGVGGSAHLAGLVNQIRDEVNPENVLLLDGGDVYLGAAPISQLLLGESTIDIYNMIGYDAAVYGNHAFDKGQNILISRTLESNFSWLGANIVISGTEWTTPWWSTPYITSTLGSPGNQITVGILGLGYERTPQITTQGATDGLVFRDLKETVLHYYDEIMAQADTLIILAHTGGDTVDVYLGLEELAQELIDAGKPVDLMIGGHQHLVYDPPVEVGDTAILQAGEFGKWLGRADVLINPTSKNLSLEQYQVLTITNAITPDAAVEARVAYWADIVAPVIEQPVGSTHISLYRYADPGPALGELVTDGMLWKADLLDDGMGNGSVDIAITNRGGLRDDIVIPPAATLPYTVTWGDTFAVMPFGNTLYLMDLSGAQIQVMLDAWAGYNHYEPAAGMTWWWYNDCDCTTPTTWGAYFVEVNGAPLNPAGVYRLVTNDFSASRGFFVDGTNRWNTFYDMQEGVNDYIATISPIDTGDILTGRVIKMDAPPSVVFLPVAIR